VICGFFWEMWNLHSLAKWVYSIPYVHVGKVFEMPILGYAGYLPFGLECLFAAQLAGWRHGLATRDAQLRSAPFPGSCDGRSRCWRWPQCRPGGVVDRLSSSSRTKSPLRRL
jgi:hypothetical protein